MQGVDEKCTKVILGKYEEKRPLTKSRRRWKDDVKIYLKCTESKVVA
jgi:hypothetical protein